MGMTKFNQWYRKYNESLTGQSFLHQYAKERKDLGTAGTSGRDILVQALLDLPDWALKAVVTRMKTLGVADDLQNKLNSALSKLLAAKERPSTSTGTPMTGAKFQGALKGQKATLGASGVAGRDILIQALESLGDKEIQIITTMIKRMSEENSNFPDVISGAMRRYLGNREHD